MTLWSTFLESSLNFLFNNLKKPFQNLIESERNAVSKFQLLRNSLKKQSGDKIACKTHLE